MSYPAFKGTRARTQQPRYMPPTTEDEFSTADVDHYAVERAVSGEQPRVELTEAEKRVAALFLRKHDMPRAHVSVYLCVYERLVKEWEAEAGMLGPDDLCTEPDCSRARAGRGYCATCLNRVRIQEKHWKAAVAELGMAA